MQANAIESKKAETGSEGHPPYAINAVNAITHAPQFKRALDGRKRPVRGLWVATASGRYYCQLTVEDDATGATKVRRGPLLDKDRQPAGTAAQAVEAIASLKTQRADGEL